MPKIYSPFSSSTGANIGQTIANLGKEMFGNQTANAFNNEKLYAAQRENTERDNLMRQIAQGGGAQDLGSNPLAQAMIVGAGYDPADFAKMGLMGAATEYGARDERTQGWQIGAGQSYSNTAGAFDAKLAEERRSNDLTSADRRYDVDQRTAFDRYKFGNLSADQAADNAENTRNNDMQSADRRYGVDQTRQQRMDEFANEPKPALGTDGQPTFVPQADLAKGGFSPILSESDQKGQLLGQNWTGLPELNPNQQEVLGARVSGDKAGTPRNYIMPGGDVRLTYDGRNDVNGSPLPAGGHIGTVEGDAKAVGLTNSTLGGLQQQVYANRKFSNLLNMTRDLAKKDPMNFGIPGFVKEQASNLSELANGVATGLGNKDMQEAVQEVRKAALQNGIAPDLLSGLFDPTQSGLQTVSDLLVYAAAEALAGQGGRNASDKDIQFFRGIVGSPQSWLMNQSKYLAKLEQIDQILRSNDQAAQDFLATGTGGQPSPQPAAPSPAPATPAAPPNGQTRTGAKWSIVQ